MKNPGSPAPSRIHESRSAEVVAALRDGRNDRCPLALSRLADGLRTPALSEVSVSSISQLGLAPYVGPVLDANVIVDLDRQPLAVQAVRSVTSRT